MNKYIVITTINPKTEGLARFEGMEGWNLIIVGDKKSKPIDSSKNLTFLSVEDQRKLNYSIVDMCPYNHYARKNIGYLYALEQGADVIYDTDDDNLPYGNWHLPDFKCAKRYTSIQKYINIYKYFTRETVWPRGYPLDEIHKFEDFSLVETKPLKVGVWQGLADNDPDVDAIYRLTANKELKFEDKPQIAIDKGCYSPFNSQNTFWNRKAFPFLYLPATTSFRFTDILRGYIAQPLLWVDDFHLGFTSATVYQERNSHDLMKDFKDEIECYLHIKGIVRLLDSLRLGSNSLTNILNVYHALSDNKFVHSNEVQIVEAWVSDFKKVYCGNIEA